MGYHRRALDQLHPGALSRRQALGPVSTGVKEQIDVIAGEHFKMQFFLRSIRAHALVLAEVPDQGAGLDRHRLVQYHDAVGGQRSELALQ
ncbi:hypothetical protein D3C87_1224060 [compost metagenome]